MKTKSRPLPALWIGRDLFEAHYKGCQKVEAAAGMQVPHHLGGWRHKEECVDTLGTFFSERSYCPGGTINNNDVEFSGMSYSKTMEFKRLSREQQRAVKLHSWNLQSNPGFSESEEVG